MVYYRVLKSTFALWTAGCGLLWVLCNARVQAQTVFLPGDLAIVGVASDVGNDLPTIPCDATGVTGRDRIYLVCFKDLLPGTTLDFTDNGWERRFLGRWGNSEGFWRLTRTGATILAGTTLCIEFPADPSNGAPIVGFPDADWTWSGSGHLNMNMGGDQLFVLQGGTWDGGTGCPAACNEDASYNGGRILYACTNNGWSTQQAGTADNPYQSRYPPDLLPCASVSLTGDFNSYKMPTNIGSAVSWINRIRQTANWANYPNCSAFVSPPLRFNLVPYTARLDCIGSCVGCTPLTAFFRVNLSLPVAWGPFTLQYTDGAQQYILNNVTDGQSFARTFSESDTLRIVSLTAANGCAAPFIYDGNAAVMVYPRPVYDEASPAVCTALPVNLSDIPYVGTDNATVTLTFHTGPNPNAGNILPNSTVPAGVTNTYYGLAIDQNGCRDTFSIALMPGGLVSAGKPRDTAFCARGLGPSLLLPRLLQGETTGGTWTLAPGSDDPQFNFNPATGLLGTSGLPAGHYRFRYDISAPGCGQADTAISVLVKGPDTTMIQRMVCDANSAGSQQVERLKGRLGCDSIVIVTAIYRAPTRDTLNTWVCDPTQQGTFTTTLTDRNGCDSIFRHTNAVYVPSDTTRLQETTCDATLAGLFAAKYQNTRGCDSLVLTQRTFVPSDTTRLQETTCDATLAGSFTTKYKNFKGCDSLVLTQRTFVPTDTTRLQETTCDATLAGSFTTKYKNVKGCDSLVLTQRTFVPSDTTRLHETTCDATLAGSFTAKYKNFKGCDSLVLTQRTFVPSDTTRLHETTCDATLAGSFTAKYKNFKGCDSLVLTQRTFVPSDTTRLHETTCDATLAGSFTTKYKNTRGCDSLVLTQRTFVPSDTTRLQEITCDATLAGSFTTKYKNTRGCDSLVLTQRTYVPPDTTHLQEITCDATLAGSFTAKYQNTRGCDSLVLTQRTFVPSDTTRLQETTCDATLAGSFTAKYKNFKGCDSLVLTQRTFVPSDTTRLQETTCDATLAGSFTAKYKNVKGCDSLVLTQRTFVPSDTTRLHETTCDATLAGSFTTKYKNVKGCDSLVLTQRTFVPSDTTRLQETTCDATLAGSFTTKYKNVKGCDSLVLTQRTFVPSDTTRLHETTCDATLAGSFTAKYKNVKGCDSLVLTQRTFVPSDTTHLQETTCDATLAGSFTTKYKNVKGCDSLVLTQRTFVPSDTTRLRETTCDINLSGLFTATYQNFGGCDSLVLTQRTYIPPDTTYLNETTCDVRTSGTFTQKLKNAYGCDSTVIRLVAWVRPDSTFLELTTCSAALSGLKVERWQNHAGCDSTVFKNVTYVPTDTTFFFETTCDPLQEGVRLQGLTGVDGCDSLIVTTVRLNPSFTVYLDSFICNPQGTGVVSRRLQAVNGCDSLVVISMIYRQPDSTFLTGFTCDSLERGRQLRRLHNRYGCDSLVFTDYEWLRPSVGILNTKLCAGEFVTVNGQRYDIDRSKGVERLAGVSQTGCDSLVLINLQFSFLNTWLSSRPPVCPSSPTGFIAIDTILNGTPPYEYSRDGTFFRRLQVPKNISGLVAGRYIIHIRDSKSCSSFDTFDLQEPPLLRVDINGARSVLLGDSIPLLAVPNFQAVSIAWQADSSLSCWDCANPTATPITSRTYRVAVVDSSGCAVEGSLSVSVKRHPDVYIPNIFSPNDDGHHDELLLSAGPSVAKVRQFQLFDRWGERVFAFDNLSPSDIFPTWDGRLNGRLLPPGVFTYWIEVEYIDRTVARWGGDVGLVR